MTSNRKSALPPRPGGTGAGRENSESIQSAANFAAAFGVSRETVDRLDVYAALLSKWQRTINLVAPKTLTEVWHRHFADSAQLMALAPAKQPLHWLDLGSGAGFPGLVIGIMLAERGGDRLTLIESDTRKAAFLREVVRATGIGARLTVDIVAERIESAANHTRVEAVDVVSARALAPLPKLIGLAHAFMGPESVGLLLKGRELAVELAEAERMFAFEHQVLASRTDPSGQVLVVRHVRIK